jgi:hypothetical protein
MAMDCHVLTRGATRHMLYMLAMHYVAQLVVPSTHICLDRPAAIRSHTVYQHLGGESTILDKQGCIEAVLSPTMPWVGVLDSIGIHDFVGQAHTWVRFVSIPSTRSNLADRSKCRNGRCRAVSPAQEDIAGHDDVALAE